MTLQKLWVQPGSAEAKLALELVGPKGATSVLARMEL